MLALVVSLGLNLWQYVRWDRLYFFQATQFKDGLYNTAISLDYMLGKQDQGERSLDVTTVVHAPPRLMEVGAQVDRMEIGGGLLSRVGYELNMFTIGLWSRHGLKAPEPGSRQNPLPPEEDLIALRKVYEVYQRHFAEAVIVKGSPANQRTALIAAHDELKSLGLIRLLPEPFVLDRGLN